jgi:hypothetical protein
MVQVVGVEPTRIVRLKGGCTYHCSFTCIKLVLTVGVEPTTSR